jgi:hypothetical protein
VEKKLLHIVTVCVVALITQHEMRERHIIICGLPDFKSLSTLSHKTHGFLNKKTF